MSMIHVAGHERESDSEELDRPLQVPATRARLKWYHYVGDFMNTVKAFIGTNYQALPFAFSQSGLISGVVGVVLIAITTDHCCQLLIRSKHHLIRKLCQEEEDKGRLSSREIMAMRQRLERIMGYGDIGRRVFGNACFHVIQAAVCFTQYTTVIAYFIFIANTIEKMIPNDACNKTVTNHSDHSLQLAHGVPLLYLDNIGRPVPDLDLGRSVRDLAPERSLPDAGAGLYVAAVPNASTIGPEVMTTDGTTTTTDTTTPVPVQTSTSSDQNTTTTTPPPDEGGLCIDLRLLFLIPLPFFLATSLLRSMRTISPFSSIATLALVIGALSVLYYLIDGFSIGPNYRWAKLYTLPIFIGQLTSAFEGIGCVVPIESSMEGNRRIFRWYLHMGIGSVACVLVTYGTLGYMRYGDEVHQLIVTNINSEGIGPKFVDVTLIISVLFTFPLQCFPVIEVLESYIFGSSQCCGRHSPRLEYDEIGSGIQNSSEETGLLTDSSIESSVSSVAHVVPPQVPWWKRNTLRILIILSVCGFGILLRDNYAYLGAFTGALGASLLAFVFPCMIHLQVRSHTMPYVLIAKDITIIIFAVLASLLAIIVIIYKMATGQMEL